MGKSGESLLSSRQIPRALAHGLAECFALGRPKSSPHSLIGLPPTVYLGAQLLARRLSEISDRHEVASV